MFLRLVLAMNVNAAADGWRQGRPFGPFGLTISGMSYFDDRAYISPLIANAVARLGVLPATVVHLISSQSFRWLFSKGSLELSLSIRAGCSEEGDAMDQEKTHRRTTTDGAQLLGGTQTHIRGTAAFSWPLWRED